MALKPPDAAGIAQKPTARSYTLQPAKLTRKAEKQRVVPPRPKPGERRPLAYSSDDLNALWATAYNLDWKCLVSLKSPSSARITSWEALKALLKSMKKQLDNLHRRKGFPACIAITEFDAYETDGHSSTCAGFHIAFSEELSQEQIELLQAWWLRLMELPHNQGRHFQYDAKGGGPDLQAYLAKDLDKRTRHWRHVKFHPDWLPPRLEHRLWFVVGMKRQPARKGRLLRASTGKRRKRFEGEHGNSLSKSVRVSTGRAEDEHGNTPITADGPRVSANEIPAVSVSAREAVSPSLSPIDVPVPSPATSLERALCQTCWTRWGRSLWAGSCVCTGDVEGGSPRISGSFRPCLDSLTRSPES